MNDMSTQETGESNVLRALNRIVTTYPFRQDVYTDRDPRNNIVDGEPRALYWYQYRRAYELLRDRLVAGQPVDNDLPVIVIARSMPLPTDFDLTRGDRAIIGDFITPGISMHIAFTDNCSVACGAIFDRLNRSNEHLYYLPDTSGLLEIGYVPYYLPTPNQPLHIRVVHQKHLEDPSLHMVPFNARKKLAAYLGDFKVC